MAEKRSVGGASLQVGREEVWSEIEGADHRYFPKMCMGKMVISQCKFHDFANLKFSASTITSKIHPAWKLNSF